MESGVASVEPEPAPVEIRGTVTESGAAPVDVDLSAAEAPGALSGSKSGLQVNLRAAGSSYKYFCKFTRGFFLNFYKYFCKNLKIL